MKRLVEIVVIDTQMVITALSSMPMSLKKQKHSPTAIEEGVEGDIPFATFEGWLGDAL